MMTSPCHRERRELLLALHKWRRGNAPIDTLAELEQQYMRCQKNRNLRPVDQTYHYRALYTHMLSQLTAPERLTWVLNREI